MEENTQPTDTDNFLSDTEKRAEDYLANIVENRLNFRRWRRTHFSLIRRANGIERHRTALHKRAERGQEVKRGERAATRKSTKTHFAYRPKRTTPTTTRDKEKFNDKGKIRRQWKKDHPGEY